jgi:hypothetical protein
LGLNLGIAAANIISFSPRLIGLELFGASALETALGITFIFLSGTGLIYGNYEFLAGSEKVVQTNKIWKVEDYIEAQNIRKNR